MPNGSLVENALMAKLINDAQLKSMLPDGWWWDVATEGQKRFGVVSLVNDENIDVFVGKGFGNALYLVKAVMLNASSVNIEAAAARIDDLLNPNGQGSIIAVPDYGEFAVSLDSRVRYTERDEKDTAIRWIHRGGRYRLEISIA